MSLDLRFAGLLACFLLSGSAALLFQVAWTREFAFVFGTSELAIATVLAAYMGGLAGGAACAQRALPHLRRPLRAYALLEAGIGVSALLVPDAIRAATRLVVALYGGQPELPSEGGLGAGLFYTACSLLILAVPTACMGATLPVLARVAVRSDAEVGPRIGSLYAINTAGAVLGALAAAFWLLPELGLRRTVWCGVGLNALVTAAALLLSRAAEAGARGPLAPIGAGGLAPPREAAAAREEVAPRAGSQRWILPLMLVSGAASFSYELLWTRLLSHLFGGSLFSFATMLASFLTGIALGSQIAARFATQRAAALRGFALAELGVAAASIGVYAGLDALPGLASALGTGRASHAANAAIALGVLLPPALFLGATFPLAVRALALGPADAASAAARVYGWNTAGAIAGSLATGFVGLPALGFSGVLRAAAGSNLALAVVALALAPRGDRRGFWAALAAIAAAGALLGSVEPPWRLLGATPFDLGAGASRLLYHGVGRSASVAAVETAGGSLELRSNGLKESAIRRPGEVETLSYAWLGGLPAMLRPEARSLLVVGLGGGGTLELLPRSFERVDVVEIEAEMLRANRFLASARALDPLADPRVAIAINDVRGALLLSERRFDAVVSQPSHPWTEGASHLYTRDFFALVKQRLAPGGILVQWVGTSFLDEGLLRSALATLLSVFAHVQVYLPYPYGEVYFAASDAALDWKASARRFVAAAPEDAARFGVAGPEDLLVALRLDEAAARELARGAPLIRDDHNLFQFQLQGRPGRVQRLLAGRIPASAAEGLDAAYLARRLYAAGETARALAIDPQAAGREGAAPPPAVARARALAEAQRFSELALLDAELAAIGLRDASWPAAVQLRMRWRVESGVPARAREAAALAEPLLVVANRIDPYFWRAQALALAGDHEAAAAALAQIARQLASQRRAERSARFREAMRGLVSDSLALLPASGEPGRRRRELEARFARLLSR